MRRTNSGRNRFESPLRLGIKSTKRIYFAPRFSIPFFRVLGTERAFGRWVFSGCKGDKPASASPCGPPRRKRRGSGSRGVRTGSRGMRQYTAWRRVFAAGKGLTACPGALPVICCARSACGPITLRRSDRGRRINGVESNPIAEELEGVSQPFRSGHPGFPAQGFASARGIEARTPDISCPRGSVPGQA